MSLSTLSSFSLFLYFLLQKFDYYLGVGQTPIWLWTQDWIYNFFIGLQINYAFHVGREIDGALPNFKQLLNGTTIDGKIMAEIFCHDLPKF